MYCTLYLPRASDNTRRAATPVFILTTDTWSLKIKNIQREREVLLHINTKAINAGLIKYFYSIHLQIDTHVDVDM